MAEEEGFEPSIGLFRMRNVPLGNAKSGEPLDDPNLAVEGWILGLDHRVWTSRGEPAGTRTPDREIKSLLLYQLSYGPGR